jgi:hypothetical protein
MSTDIDAELDGSAAGAADIRSAAGSSGNPDGYSGDQEPETDASGVSGHSGSTEATGGLGNTTGVQDGRTEPVAWRTPTGWRVGDEEVPDLTSAMVLADILAAELPVPEPADPSSTASMPAGPMDPQRGGPATTTTQGTAPEIDETQQLRETVAQLERALTVRVRVEQAIGVLAERHRIRPRQAFELLRSASRARGKRIIETATEVIASATNPLLRIPDELAKPPMARRLPRHSRGQA